MKKVGIIMGSVSDLPVVQKTIDTLTSLDVPYEAHVYSAHRTPDLASRIASSAKEDGYSVIIAAAGLAAHLAGVIAAHTVLPVIGVPCKGGALHGVDALYAVVQMPTGIPVATVAIDGGSNAAILAAQMLALSDEALSRKLVEYKAGLAASVAERDARLQEKIANIGE